MSSFKYCRSPGVLILSVSLFFVFAFSHHHWGTQNLTFLPGCALRDRRPSLLPWTDSRRTHNTPHPSLLKLSMGASDEYGSGASGEKLPMAGSAPTHGGDTIDRTHGEVVDHGADSELQRRLSSRHITFIALGSSIGMGLWLGSGTSLSNGGPAALFIGCKSTAPKDESRHCS